MARRVAWLCIPLLALVLACTALAGVSPASHYARLFRSTYNAEATANHWPYRITWIACTGSQEGRGYFDCGVKIILAHGSKVQCGVIVIDTGFDVLVNHLVPCSSLKPRTIPA